MKTGKWFWVILLSALLVLPLLLIFFHQNIPQTATEPMKEPPTVTVTSKEKEEPKETPSQPQATPQEPPKILWGVDTASNIDQAFLQCVVDNYGQPSVFGRYLETKEGVSAGIDEGFIRGWVETLLGSSYKPGIYGVFTDESTLTAAYQGAIASNENVQSNTIIWSSNPDPGVTPQSNAPEFQPGAPANVPVSIWQYGIDGETCNIDTNLIQSNILDFLW